MHQIIIKMTPVYTPIIHLHRVLVMLFEKLLDSLVFYSFR